MAHVIVLDSINSDLFVCGLCKIVFNTLQVFIDHKNNCQANIEKEYHTESQCSTTQTNSANDNTKSLPLENCSVGESSWEQCSEIIAERLVGKDNNANITCTLCMKTFKKVTNLLTHQKSHNFKSFQCPICGRCFVMNSLLQRHISCHKVWPNSLSQTTPKSAELDLLSYSCSYCEATVPNYNQYRIHLKLHTKLKMYKCIQGDCTKMFEILESLLQHISTSHQTLHYICYSCKNTFTSLEEIARHQQSHSEHLKELKQVKQYKCSQCDAVFRKPDKLSLHLSTESHKKSCIHCSKVFASDKRLRAHLQVHSKGKPFSCNICGSRFHMKKYLVSHMTKHGARVYACSICKHTFKRQDLLSRHVKGHQVKKLKCPFKDVLQCKMEFTRSDKLKSHINRHTKHLTTTSVDQIQETNMETLEICIVPLDNKDP